MIFCRFNCKFSKRTNKPKAN